MQAEMPPHWGPENTTSSIDTGTPGQAIRPNITQELLRASERDCNDSRNRFIPRAKLFDIIKVSLVEQLLRTIPGSHIQDAVRYICPDLGECFCDSVNCTGRRMILGTLFLCGREDLILKFLPPQSPDTCDTSLPLRFNSPGASHHGLSEAERELFTHFQWHVYTPFLTGIASGKEDVAVVPNEVSLPWMEKERIDEGNNEVSYVERIEVHPLNHNLVSLTVESSRAMMSSADLCDIGQGQRLRTQDLQTEAGARDVTGQIPPRGQGQSRGET